MTRLQIIELIKEHHPDLTGRQIELYLDTSANRIISETDINKVTFLYNSIAGQRWYNLDSTIKKINKVEFNDVMIPRLIGDPIIDDDEFVEPSDTEDTALTTPTANASNKRFWILSDYDSDKTTAKTKRLGIVEKVNNTVTRDGRTSNYQSCSITGTSNIRVYAVATARGASTSTVGAGDDGNSSSVGPLNSIPEEFHEVLLNGAISLGYTNPKNTNFDLVAFYDNEFQKGIKRIKKYERTKYSTGFIRPQDF